MNPPRAIALFGGTFDPIHIGHLRAAIELREQLGFDEVRLVPCHQPPHRATPAVDSAARRAMVEMAIAGETGLVLDDRELRRAGPSFTIDTLVATRAEIGVEAVLALVIGVDAFAALDTWQRWRELLDFAHIVVMERPAAVLPQTGPVAELLLQYRSDVTALRTRTHGAIVPFALPPLWVSATALRALLAAGNSPRYLLPDVVWAYIREHRLYSVK
ncbi:MAG: nicotinate-nucleotide adenylyltransferase [Spongiibacteraceae bacterium]